MDAAYTTKKTGVTLYGSVPRLIGRGGGVDEGQLSLFQLNQNVQLGNFTIQVIPSKHSPNNVLKDDGLVIGKPLSRPAKMKAYSEGGAFDFLY